MIQIYSVENNKTKNNACWLIASGNKRPKMKLYPSLQALYVVSEGDICFFASWKTGAGEAAVLT